MRVLLTGGTGFIGCYISKKLLQQGHQPLLLDIAPDRELAQKILGKDAAEPLFIEGDILNIDEFSGTVKECRADAIVHLVALRNNDSQANPEKAFQLNCTGTINVFETARRLGIARVVYASSVAVLGSSAYYRQMGFDPLLLPDEVPVNPYNFYGATKAFNEFSGAQYNNIYGLETVGVRLAIIYGIGKKEASLTGMITSIVDNPARGLPVEVPVPPDFAISFQHVADAAEALTLPLFAPALKRPVYNGGGSNVTFAQIADCVRALVPGAQISLSGNQLPDVATCIDSSRAEADFGYKPQPLEQRLARHIEEVRQG